MDTNKLKAKDLPAYRERRLALTGGACELCANPVIRPCADHCHQTGFLRGTICSSCNVLLGKIERGKRYGRDFDALAFAKGLYDYLTRPNEGLVHPSHGRKGKK